MKTCIQYKSVLKKCEIYFKWNLEYSQIVVSKNIYSSNPSLEHKNSANPSLENKISSKPSLENKNVSYSSRENKISYAVNTSMFFRSYINTRIDFYEIVWEVSYLLVVVGVGGVRIHSLWWVSFVTDVHHTSNPKVYRPRAPLTLHHILTGWQCDTFRHSREIKNRLQRIHKNLSRAMVL